MVWDGHKSAPAAHPSRWAVSPQLATRKTFLSRFLTRIDTPEPLVTRVPFRAGVPSKLGEAGLKEFFFPNFDSAGTAPRSSL